MADTIEDKILNKMKKCGRGSVFFIPDFVSYGNRNAINKALERLTDKGLVLRAARGIYCYPKIEKVYGLGSIPPSMEDIAEAMAKRDGATCVALSPTPPSPTLSSPSRSATSSASAWSSEPSASGSPSPSASAPPPSSIGAGLPR